MSCRGGARDSACMFSLALTVAAAVAAPVNSPCAACAAVANELERQMHEEWGHLQLTVRDRKRKLAKDAVKEEACGEAIQQILAGICGAVKDYAVGYDSDGALYYQKVKHLDNENVVVTGSLTIGGKPLSDLDAYCGRLMHSHEDQLAKIMADGTDDLLSDLCVATAAECTAAAAAALPEQGRPRRHDK